MTTALISVYYPTVSVKAHVRDIAEQVDKVYICDNSPFSNQQMFAQINVWEKLHYTCFYENLGLSCAFNRILKDSALWNEDDYIFFFDQDSQISEQHIEKMIATYEDLRGCGYPIGCLGPVYFNTSNNLLEIPKAKRILQNQTYEVSGIITSSMLCVYRDLENIGFWNEDVFLDMADWDICWRMQAAGKICCMTENTVLRHSVGSGEKKVGPLRLRIGQPFREYYQMRDGFYLFCKKYAPVKFRIRYLAMLFIRSPLHLLFLEGKRERFRYICKGLADYIKGKKGVLNTT